jgi:hypothetical protein
VNVLGLPAGSYRLTVKGAGNATGAYAFLLLDLADATPVEPDSEIVGTLAPGNGTLAYRIEAAAGDQLAFQSNSVSGGNAAWRLIDRFGRDGAGANELTANHAAVTLTAGGVYTLLVEGRADNITPVDFSIQFNAAGNAPQPALPAGEALSLGTVVSGTVATNTPLTYRFSLAEDSLLVLDTQNPGSSSVQWSLVGPRGSEVSKQTLYSGDANYAYPVFGLLAGDYALTLSSSGAYAFRLLDVSAFPTLALGQPTTATRSPGNATLGYRFDAEAGAVLALNARSSNSVWTLVDPYGTTVSSVSGDSYNATTFVAPVTGSYTLLNEGYYSSTGNSAVTFTLGMEERTQAPLVLNDAMSGTLDDRRTLTEYVFTVDTATTLVFDALTADLPDAGTPQWSLRGPLGTVSSWTSLSTQSSSRFLLAPGQYSLLLRNTQDTLAAYKFRLLDRDAAIGVVPGNPVDDFIPTGETHLYRFHADAGERYYFDGQSQSTTDAVQWSLIDPFGRVVRSGYSNTDYSDIVLDTGGEYLLMAWSYSSNQPSRARFSLLSKSLTTAPLALNQPIAGEIVLPGEIVNYSFTLANPARIMVDAGSGSGFRWSLSGPRGSEAAANGFG